jgi:hypothetical protein
MESVQQRWLTVKSYHRENPPPFELVRSSDCHLKKCSWNGIEENGILLSAAVGPAALLTVLKKRRYNFKSPTSLCGNTKSVT